MGKCVAEVQALGRVANHKQVHILDRAAQINHGVHNIILLELGQECSLCGYGLAADKLRLHRKRNHR